MSNRNSKQAETAAAATEEIAPVTEQISETTEQADVWVSPYDVNYKELESILDGEDFADYVGDRLPEEEVKRIKTDYELYLINK